MTIEMDLGAHLQFSMYTDPRWSVVTLSTGLVVGVADSVLSCHPKRWKADAPGLCTHRAENVTTHNAASIDGQRPLRCVPSNLARVACRGGTTAAPLTTIARHGDGVIACDTHSDLNSSTASLTGDCFPDEYGQTLHRHNLFLPATAATVALHCSTCRSFVIPRPVANRVAPSCALHDQSSLTTPNCDRCLSAFTRSLVLLEETYSKALLYNSFPTQFDHQLLHFKLSTLAWPPVPMLASFSTNHSFVSEGNLSLDVNPNCELTSWISHAAQFAKMYPTSCSKSRQQRLVASCSTLLSSINSDSSTAPVASQLNPVDKSMSIRAQHDKSNETKEDLNSICKYLPTTDQADRRQAPVNSECSVDGHPSPARYQIHSPLPSQQKTSRVGPPPCRPVAVWWTQLLFFVMLICQMQPSVHASANIRAIEKQILDKIIGPGSGYDSRIRPMGNGTSGPRGGDGPSTIDVNILIRSISKISDLDMEYSVQLTFRQEWVDSRLKFDDKGGQIRYLVLTEPEKVWRPDLFFKNEKEGHFHEIIVPNVLFRIYPAGGVLYSIRISLVLACPMDLKYYPLDKQICGIQMASYGYTDEDLVFIWKQLNPVQITKHLHLPRFTLEKYRTDYCTSKTNTGAYSCLEVGLLFKREFSYYLIQIYIPCCMLVIVSWVSFWLDPNAIPARVSLGVTTLLTMATSISGINSSLPPVSYTKAIDVWTGVCLTFVFGALLEFALVNYASRSDAHRAALKQQQAAFAAQRKWDLEHAALDVDPIDDRASAFAMRPLVRQHGNFGGGDKMRTCEIHVSLPKRNWCKRWLSKFPTRSKRIDVISRIFFPLMFALFNLVYWTTYLFREDMQNLNQKLKI